MVSAAATNVALDAFSSSRLRAGAAPFTRQGGANRALPAAVLR